MIKKFAFCVMAVISFNANANKFDIAHVREQGQDMIIIPLDSNFEYKSDDQKRNTMYALQTCASNARLGGTVVLIWESNGRTKFMAPQPWHGLFRSVDMLWVAKRINKSLTCR